MPDPSEALDSEVLRLRTAGRAFARIGRELGLEKSADAHAAFQRAVGRLSVEDRDEVRVSEKARLDRLAARVQADADTPPDQRARKLAGIERLRSLIAKEG